jgi:MFS family permease
LDELMAGIFLLLLGYVLSQFYRSFLAVLSPVLTSELAMTPGDLSNASAAWFIVFALAQFPIGYWLDIYGPRRTASYLLVLGGAGGIGLFATANSAGTIIFAMGMIGLGCAPVLMASFFLFARMYDEARFATLAAVFVGLGTLGNVIGTEPLAAAANQFGWRNVAWLLCAVTAMVAIGVLAVVKDPELESRAARRGSVTDLFKIRELWFIFPIVFLGYGAAINIRGLWAGPFLSDMYGLGSAEIGRITLYMALALAAGSMAYGPLDRMFNSRKWVVFVGNTVVLGTIIWFYAGPEKSLWQVAAGFVVIGFFGAGYAVQMAHGKAFVPAHLTGRGVTLLNFFSIGGAGILQYLSGLRVEMVRAEADIAASYNAMFEFYMIALAATLLVYLFSVDARPGAGKNQAR